MTPCPYPGCSGYLLPTGFCDGCRRRRPADPTVPVHTAAALPEDKRFCANCEAPVGRGDGDRPGREVGYCANCGFPFSFSPKLAAGDLVEERYEVRGPHGRGGLGWVYLAHDKHLHMHVVLKGLLNTADSRAKELVANERIALTTLDHPNVVRIHDFVRHPDPRTGEPLDYIVMEYVDGPTLEELRTGHGPMSPEKVIAYVLQILDALKYLHGVGLLYCDMKPHNVILRRDDRIKVIDLGAVRAIENKETEWVRTPKYGVSDEEVAQHDLTVRSDLHTVGRTLEELYQATPDAISERAGHRGPVSLGLRSLRHVYERALDHHDRRYTSAGEMAEQLRGVLREIVALRDGVVRPGRSAVFSESTALLDAGLGAVPPVEHWLDHDPEDDEPPVEPPALVEIAHGLPPPLVPADDPAAGFLATLTTTRPTQVLAALDEPPTRMSAEVLLRACRELVELKEFTAARERLRDAERLAPGTSWRTTWHSALIDLAEGDVPGAKRSFTMVYRDLPGEDAPKMALGLCAEHEKDLATATAFHHAVWSRERRAASAAFGLARVALACGDPRAAVAHLDQILDRSRFAQEARIAAIRVLCGQPAPAADDLAEANTRLSNLSTLDDGDPRGPARVRLTALVRAAEVRRSPARARGPREALERSLRAVARQAHTQHEHDVLVSRANAVRPWTFL